MLNQTFYHTSIRKYLITFGNLFSEIYVRRFNKDGAVVQTLPVPLKFGPRAKWLAMLADPTQTKPVGIQMPMISFEMKSFKYDKDRKLQTTNKMSNVIADRDRKDTAFQPVPYKLGIEMNIIAKFNDDASQIIEQIVPYFTPSHFNTIDLIPGIAKPFDIKIELTDCSPEYEYEGSFTEYNKITWRLQFEMDVWFVGPVSNQGVIKRVIVNFSGNENDPYIDERVIITPGLTANGLPTSDKNNTIPYKQINEEDDYGYIEEYYTYNNQKLETDIEQD